MNLPEPVAYMIDNGIGKPFPSRADGNAYAFAATKRDHNCTPLFTAEQMAAAVAQERERLCQKPLTDTHIDYLKAGPSQTYRDFARAVERAHGIGATPTEQSK